MLLRIHRPVFFAAAIALSTLPLGAQVFVVGQKSATADLSTEFTPTHLDLPSGELNERGRRELVRMLEAEQGFAHRALPMGNGLTLRANGPLEPGVEQYKHMIYEKGQAAAAGDRVLVTSMVIKADRIVFDLNGGPFEKHRFLSHVQLNNGNVVQTSAEKPTGARVTLVFNGKIPDISAPEIKSLLEPVIDFGVKSSEQAYADTLPQALKDAIAAHDVLVGMNHRMVLAALGAPESKMREHDSGDLNGARYEEWIYGHVPQTVRFVRFQGDRVSLIEIAALGKPMEIHDKDEVAGYLAPVPTREIALGDRKKLDPDATPASAPSLKRPGEAEPANGSNRVQYPTAKPATTPAASAPAPSNPPPVAPNPFDHPEPGSSILRPLSIEPLM
jgi:hypothetical protein